MHEGLGVALPLQREFLVIDAARDIDGKDKLQVDLFGSTPTSRRLTLSQAGITYALLRRRYRAWSAGLWARLRDADPRDVAHLESLGVWRVVPGQRPAAPPPPPAPIATAPIVVPQTPPFVPPQYGPSRLERFDRDGRPLPSPPPPPASTAEEIEHENLLRSLALRGWTPDEARILAAGRSRDSLRLIGPIVPDTAGRASAAPMEMVRGGPV